MIHYTDRAISDLTRLREFIAKKNPTAANRVASGLKHEINKLDVFSKIGVKVAYVVNPEKIRDLFIGNYTVRYLIVNDDVVILRIWHDRENERSN